MGAAAAVVPAPAGLPTWPNPSRPIPIPSLSTSLGLLWCCGRELLLADDAVFTGVGFMISDFAAAMLLVLFLAASLACSASGSYPSFSILSASALAAFSAASKSSSSATIFFAPSFCVFLAPRMFVRFAAVGPVVPGFRIADAGVARIAVGAGRAFSASAAAAVRGDLGRALAPLAVPAERKGDPVRAITGGVPTRDGGLLGRFIAGLSHEEKKSSSPASIAGVEPPSPGVPATSSVITTSSG